MTITLTQVETLLLKRCAGRMEAAGMNHVITEHNPDLVDPLDFALLCMDIVPANPLAPDDSDLASIADADFQQLLDLAELRLLENVIGNLSLVDVTVGPRKESLNQIADQTEKAIARLSAKIANSYGLGTSTIDTGVVSLDFAQKGTDTFDYGSETYPFE